jgi:uncharacterized phage protein (TIGR02220 family)
MSDYINPKLAARLLYYYGMTKGQASVRVPAATIARLLDVDTSELCAIMPLVVRAMRKVKATWRKSLIIHYGKVDARPAQIREVFAYWQTKLDKPRSRLTDRRRDAIRARLSDGYTVDDIKLAIDGIHKSKWHNGDNDRGMEFNDVELVCRTGEHVERFQALATRRRAPVNVRQRIRSMQHGK